MAIRDDLKQVVDQLDDEQTSELLEYARWLAADEESPSATMSWRMSVWARRRSPRATT